MIDKSTGTKITMTDADGLEHDIRSALNIKIKASYAGRMQAVNDSLAQFRDALIVSFSPSMEKFSEAATVLYNEIYKGATRRYRQKFGRLPGSSKTKRLRKKQRDAVSRYLLGE